MRFGLSGPFQMLGDVFGNDRPGEYVWAFLDEEQVAAKRLKAEELKSRPTQNPHRAGWTHPARCFDARRGGHRLANRRSRVRNAFTQGTARGARNI